MKRTGEKQLEILIRVIPKIAKCGRSITLVALIALLNSAALAGDIRFSATVDQTQVEMGDSVTLRLSIESDSGGRAGEPQIDAPDFDVVNQFNSYSMSSQYDSSSGKFTTVNSQQISKVLSPRKTGDLKISNIAITAGGKVYHAKDIVVQVVPAGRGSSHQAQRGAPAGGSGNAAHSQSRQAQETGVLLRAEIDKETAYKGEQIVVSYYLYHQSKIFNLQVDKFPVLTGFLREDLDVPVMGQRLESEHVVLNGVPYERSLLARYAAYPLQEGRLNIDSLSIRFNYYSRQRVGGLDEDDPFFGFFQQMAPRVAVGRSEPIAIQVKSIPSDGKPESFTGGIGEFTVTTAIDKYEVHANEAVNLTVKVDGRGNISNVQTPKYHWPSGVDLYDSKGRTQNGKGGGGERIFEFLLIPRVPGKMTLPPLELGFFDPVQGKYYTKSTDPISLNVLDPLPGTSLVKPTQSQLNQADVSVVSKGKADDVRPLKLPADSALAGGRPLWQILYWIFSGLVVALLSLIGWDLVKANREKRNNSNQKHSKNWEKLKASAENAMSGISWSEVTQAYEGLAGIVFDAIDRAYGVSSRSLSRSELKQILVEQKGLKEPVWEKASEILEFTEMVRYATSAGVVTEEKARNDLGKWISEGEEVVKSL